GRAAVAGAGEEDRRTDWFQRCSRQRDDSAVDRFAAQIAGMSTRRDLVRYAVAVCAVAGGLLLRVALSPLLAATVPWVTVFPAVMLASWFGGLGPGVLAMLLSLLAAFLHIMPDPTPVDAAGAVLFTGVSLFIASLTEALRRSRSQCERDRDLFRITLGSIGD